ncbi:hypothetical protein VRM59_004487 [Salmonella enterica]|nr:hypothetical protein [Salmonella enterica]
MQWLIVPVVLAVVWFLNLFPACPGFAYVILAVIYMVGVAITNAIEAASAASRRRDTEILESIAYTQDILERKNENLELELRQLKRTIDQLDKIYNPENRGF